MKVYIDGILFDAKDKPIVLVLENVPEAVAVIRSLQQQTNDAIGSNEPDAMFCVLMSHQSIKDRQAQALNDEACAAAQEQNHGPQPNTKYTSTCLRKAYNNEPIFVLRAKDPTSADMVQEWRKRNYNRGNEAKLGQALEVANQMRQWRENNPDLTKDFQQVFPINNNIH